MTRSSKAVISALHSYTKGRGFDVRRVRIFVRNGNLPRTQTLTNESWDLALDLTSYKYVTYRRHDRQLWCCRFSFAFVCFFQIGLQTEIFVTFNIDRECWGPKNFSLVNVALFFKVINKLTRALLLFCSRTYDDKVSLKEFPFLCKFWKLFHSPRRHFCVLQLLLSCKAFRQ